MARRTKAMLKKFYREIIHSEAPLADRMRAASRLQKLDADTAPAIPAPKPMTKEQALAIIASVTKGNA